MLVAGAAPAIVHAANIMPVFVRRESGLLAPEDEQFIVTGWVGNRPLTPSMVTRETLRILHQKLTFTGRVSSDFLNIGDVVTFAPQRRRVAA